jgi:hypothetical protein
MQLRKELFAADVGTLSAAVVVFTLGMGVYEVRYFLEHMHRDEQRRAGERR